MKKSVMRHKPQVRKQKNSEQHKKVFGLKDENEKPDTRKAVKNLPGAKGREKIKRKGGKGGRGQHNEPFQGGISDRKRRRSFTSPGAEVGDE